ncbi:MAG: hypothetical protein WC498_02925 [Candidatus Saccharimonadales bacterium]
MASEVFISSNGANGGEVHATLDKIPDECPWCHRGQKPEDMRAAFMATEQSDGFHLLQRVHRCTFTDCERIFIAFYAYKDGNARFLKSKPERFTPKKWEESIKALSPDFVEIYSQANEAESQELDKVAGPGYRKALEFLIKDWLIANKADKEEVIRTKQLGACINDYIDEQVIKDVANRAAWLGNDETHYFRKWTEKDVNDLKRLIELTASWVNMRELSNSAITEMPKPAKTDS